MNYLIDFRKALCKRLNLNIIECVFCDEMKTEVNIFTHFKSPFPIKIEYYINNYQPVIIKIADRKIELLKISDFELIEDRFLMFSKVNNTELICFDTNNINSANEWDIVNYSNNYILTKTIESYLTNKIWAFVDREREIWEQEKY